MNLICMLFGHKWLGCKCERCNEVKDSSHNWNGAAACHRCGKLHEHEWKNCRCIICGMIRDEDHRWDGCKCLICGAVRDEGHTFNDCHCTKCKKTLDNPKHVWKSRYDCHFHGTIMVSGKLQLYCGNCDATADFDTGSPYKTIYLCPVCLTEGEWESIPTEDRMFLVNEFVCQKCGWHNRYEYSDSY